MATLAKSTQSQKLERLKNQFLEQKQSFKQYKVNIEQGLAINAEVIEFVRIKCNNDAFERMLGEMERDNKIFYSRLARLDVKLEVCATYFADATRYYRRAKKSRAGCVLLYEKCLLNFIRFYDNYRECHHAFKVAQDKWLSNQQMILETESN